MWFCCWLVELEKKLIFIHSKRLYEGVFSLLTCWYGIFCLVSINLWRGGGVILPLTCWIEKIFIFSNQKKFVSRVLLSVDLLIWNIQSCIYETWEKGWWDFAVDLLNWEKKISFIHSERLYEGFFLCWLVDMEYSFLYL